VYYVRRTWLGFEKFSSSSVSVNLIWNRRVVSDAHGWVTTAGGWRDADVMTTTPVGVHFRNINDVCLWFFIRSESSAFRKTRVFPTDAIRTDVQCVRESSAISSTIRHVTLCCACCVENVWSFYVFAVKYFSYWAFRPFRAVTNHSFLCLNRRAVQSEHIYLCYPARYCFSRPYRNLLCRIYRSRRKTYRVTGNRNNKDREWIIDSPFSVTSKPAALNAAEHEVLVDMVSDSRCRVSFKSKPISEFWAQLGEGLSILSSSKAKLLLPPFGTTRLCETAFTSYRNQMSSTFGRRRRYAPSIDFRDTTGHWRAWSRRTAALLTLRLALQDVYT